MRTLHTTHARVAGLLLSLIASTKATDVNIWGFDPWYAPAPPPADGPPLSYYATRDPSLLKWQILGIVGGYVFFTVILFTALLTIGKRWRRAASQSQSSLAMEMVKPSRWIADDNAAGHKRGILSRSKSNTSSLKKSPMVAHAASFDQTVIDADKARRDEEMARLYQAVMTGDTAAPKALATMKSQDFGPGGETVSLHSRNLSNATSTRSFSQRIPPQLRSGDQSSPLSPTSPPSYRSPAFATPPQQWAASPTSPRGHSHAQAWPSAVPTVPEDQQIADQSHNRQASASSSRSRRHRSVRNLTISSPVATPGYPQEDESRPLSPRQYNPGPPPMPPGRQHELLHSPGTPIMDDGDTDDSDIIEAYGMEGLDRPRPMPMTAPQRPTITVPSRAGEVAETSPTPLSAATSTRTLPLRTYASQPSMGAPRPDMSSPLASPPPTKLTLLSPRKERFGGQGSAALHPLTAGLPTPYSAYMPRTPMTPITPRLASRAERRQRHREEGRRVATADDAVIDEDEMWGTGL